MEETEYVKQSMMHDVDSRIQHIMCVSSMSMFVIFARSSYSSTIVHTPCPFSTRRGRQAKVGPLSGDGPNSTVFFYNAVIVCLITQFSILTILCI